jgi:hypothetical protein
MDDWPIGSKIQKTAWNAGRPKQTGTGGLPMAKSLFSKLLETIRRLLGKNPEPQDPYAGVRVPLRRGPNGRHAAVAMQEPDE